MYPRIVQPLRASQNTRVPIQQELTLGITLILRPQVANWKISLLRIIMLDYQTPPSSVILVLNEDGHNRLSHSFIKCIQYCYY